MKTDIDPFDLIRAMQENAKTCTHHRLMKVMPKGGKLWQEFCPDCIYTRTLSQVESNNEWAKMQAELGLK